MKRLLQLSTLFITTLFIISCGSDSSGPNPEVTGIQPTSGPPGTSVTISGQGFRPKGNMEVTFGGTSATLISATEDQIQTEVPQSLSEGSAPVEVTVKGNAVSGPNFTVEAKAPGITSVEPDSGTVGTEVTIKGMNFSSSVSDVSITFDGTSAQVKGAAQDQLITEVPQGASDGPIEVTIKQKSTTSPPFDVITEGTIEVVTSTTGDDQDSNGYDVLIDGSNSTSADASDTIYFSDLQEGSYDVELADVAQNCAVGGSNPQSATVTAGDTSSVTFDISCQTVLKNKIVFQSDRNGDMEIYMMNADGSGVTQLTNSSGSSGYPTISNDGTKIAFSSDRNSANSQLFIMDADGSNVQQLTNSSGFSQFYSWSPDDSQLVFVDDRSGNFEIYTINADGSGENRLTNNSDNDQTPDWSPDGNTIAFASDRDGDFEIHTMNTDGSNVQQITSNAEDDTIPFYSPDGSKISFTSTRDLNFEVYVMNADGSGVQRITNNSALDALSSWSPDGSELVFQSDRDGDDEVYKINADGSGGLVKLTVNSAADQFPYWSPVE